MRALACIVLSLWSGVSSLAQGRIQVATIAPRPEDVATLDGMIRAWYEVISGPAGQPRDWARDRTLYMKDLRFVQVDLDKSGRPNPRITSHQEYVDGADAFVKDGFFEREIHRVTERYGPIAHVWSTYESRRTEKGPVIARGINFIQLYRDSDRWWITNAIWQDENAEVPIPKEHLPG